MSTLRIKTAEVFEPLLQPARYKGAYGGRGSGKSHFFGEHLVEECLAERGTLAVCIREVQKTLQQSAKRLVESKIDSLGVGHEFKVFTDKIETPGDGLIIFQGMQDHNAESIKSLEGYRIAWIEEAQTLSQRSLALLRPTIRVEHSQIWASWNPRRKSDAIDQFLRANRPDNAIVVEANWRDNPMVPRGFRMTNACLIWSAILTGMITSGKVDMPKPSRGHTSPRFWQRPDSRTELHGSRQTRWFAAAPSGILAALGQKLTQPRSGSSSSSGGR